MNRLNLKRFFSFLSVVESFVCLDDCRSKQKFAFNQTIKKKKKKRNEICLDTQEKNIKKTQLQKISEIKKSLIQIESPKTEFSSYLHMQLF